MSEKGKFGVDLLEPDGLVLPEGVSLGLDGTYWLEVPYEKISYEYSEWAKRRDQIVETVAQPVLLGMRSRIPREVGSGAWETLPIAPNFFLMRLTASFNRTFRMTLGDPGFTKIRILLSGKLYSSRLRVTLDGAGALVESYPGHAQSDYEFEKGPTSLVVLSIGRDYFKEDMGLDGGDLPFPFSNLFSDIDAAAGGSMSIGPNVLRAAVDVMAGAQHLKPLLKPQYLSAKCKEMVCLILQDSFQPKDEALRNIRCTARDVSRVHEARDILSTQLAKSPTIAELARNVGLSQTKLKIIFKNTFGITIHNFYQKCRMEKASELLSDPDRTIAEVAYELGYDHPANFSSAFKRFYGHSPRQSKRALKGASQH